MAIDDRQPSNAERAASGRLSIVDVLRGLAVIWILAFHFAVNVGGPQPLSGHYSRLTFDIAGLDVTDAGIALWRLVARLGYQGVPLFMMLSAFALTYGALRNERTRPPLTHALRPLAHMLVRYWIGFALVTVAIILLAFARHLYDGFGFAVELRHRTYLGSAYYPVDGQTIVAGLLIVPRALSDEQVFAPAPSLWFVIVLIQFYVLFPLLLRLMKALGPARFLAMTLGVALVAKASVAASHHGQGLVIHWRIDDLLLPGNLFTFGLGMTLAAFMAGDRALLRRFTSGRLDTALVLYVGLLLQTGGSLARAHSAFLDALSSPMIIAGLTLIALPAISGAQRGRPQSWRAALAVIGTMAFGFLIGGDVLQFVAGTLHTAEASTAVWVAFAVAYVPALAGLAWCAERRSAQVDAMRIARWTFPAGVRQRALVAATGGLGALGAVLLFVTGSMGAASKRLPFLPERPAVAYASRQICPLVNADGGGAHIKGQDGGTTNTIGGRTYWTFGDTVLQNGDQLPNGIAQSINFDPERCTGLVHKTDSAGNAAPLMATEEGEVSVWPAAGQVSLDGKNVYFLYNSVALADVNLGEYHFRGTGLAKFDTSTLSSTRVIEFLITSADLTGDPLTQGAAMLVSEGYVYVYFAADWNVRVARVPSSQIEQRGAYRYWDGESWSDAPSSAVDMLETAGGQQAFNVAYNPFIGKWTAVYATNTLTATAMAFADAPQGPFGDEVILFDCRGLFPRGGPWSKLTISPQFNTRYYCYHPTQHPELNLDGGRRIYLTYANLATYRLYTHQVTLGVPVAQWDDTSGHARYRTQPGQLEGWQRRGVAFYAPTTPGEGLTPIHEWYERDTGLYRYEPTAPAGDAFDDRGVAFYATLQAREGLSPVYLWKKATDPARTVYSTFELGDQGYERAATPSFYAATVSGDQVFNDSYGFVYWVHIKGESDFGCCGTTDNPTQQTTSDEKLFRLAGTPDPRGYEATVCTPTCGTGGRVVWSGAVSFSPPAVGGTLLLTPNGPNRQ